METADRQKYPTTFDLADAYREMFRAMLEDLREEVVSRQYSGRVITPEEDAKLDLCMGAVDAVRTAVNVLEAVSR